MNGRQNQTQTRKNGTKCWDVQLTHLSLSETKANVHPVNGIDVGEEKLCYEKQMGEKETHREKTPAIERRANMRAHSFTQAVKL